MKYIDAEKLKGFVRELKERAKRNSCDTWGIVPDALEEVEDFIDSLQQEQPESPKGKFVFPNSLYARTVDNKTIDVSYAPQSMDAVEYIKNDPTEQPKVDLEKASRNVYESWMGGTMNDVRNDMVELGKVLNAKKEDKK